VQNGFSQESLATITDLTRCLAEQSLSDAVLAFPWHGRRRHRATSHHDQPGMSSSPPATLWPRRSRFSGSC